MAALYTIGFTQKSLRRFVDLLRGAEVDALIDIRLRPASQLSGFARGDDLAFVLEQFGIAYEHHPELAPTAEILDGYRADKQWPRYEERFAALMDARGVDAVGKALLRRYRAPCLLCSEATPERCHRRLIAERWAAQRPGLAVTHL